MSEKPDHLALVLAGSILESHANGMAEAGWPGFELARYGDGNWAVTIWKIIPLSLCIVRAKGTGASIPQAVARAQEQVQAHDAKEEERTGDAAQS